MMKVRHILSLLLVVITIYVGAGIPVVHYCCTACAAVGIEAIKGKDCHQIHHHHEKNDACCNHSHQEEDECELTIKHIDLTTNAQNEYSELSQLPIILNNSLAIMASNFVPQLPISYTSETDKTPPLRAYTSRYYLSLYAILTI